MAELRLRRDDAGFWRALPWAVVSWLLVLWGVGFFLAGPRQDIAPPRPVDARIVEVPDTPQASPATPTPPLRQPLQPSPVPQPQLPPPSPTPPAALRPEPPPPPALPPPPPVAAAPQPVVGVVTHGLLALNQPPPQLPDDLADAAAGQTVTARFSVAADGSFTVSLTTPSDDPAVNRFVLTVLKKWTFSPAMQAGKPVSATQDVSFSF